MGNRYTVDRFGDRCEGSADNVSSNGVNIGHVDIEGVVSPRGGSIVMSNNFGVFFQSPIGTAATDQQGATDALFGTMRFHIDH